MSGRDSRAEKVGAMAQAGRYGREKRRRMNLCVKPLAM